MRKQHLIDPFSRNIVCGQVYNKALQIIAFSLYYENYPEKVCKNCLKKFKKYTKEEW